MTSPDDVVVLLDCDNTLLDNDLVQDDLRDHLAREFGVESPLPHDPLIAPVAPVARLPVVVVQLRLVIALDGA